MRLLRRDATLPPRRGLPPDPRQHLHLQLRTHFAQLTTSTRIASSVGVRPDQVRVKNSGNTVLRRTDGAGVESFPRLSLRSLATVVTRRRGENKSLTLQRPQARPARFLPRGRTDTRAVRCNEAGAGAQGARAEMFVARAGPRLTGRHWPRNWRAWKIAVEAVAAHVFEMGDPIGDLGRALEKYRFSPICSGDHGP
jgi:hypothetical protein